MRPCMGFGAAPSSAGNLHIQPSAYNHTRLIHPVEPEGRDDTAPSHTFWQDLMSCWGKLEIEGLAIRTGP